METKGQRGKIGICETRQRNGFLCFPGQFSEQKRAALRNLNFLEKENEIASLTLHKTTFK